MQGYGDKAWRLSVICNDVHAFFFSETRIAPPGTPVPPVQKSKCTKKTNGKTVQEHLFFEVRSHFFFNVKAVPNNLFSEVRSPSFFFEVKTVPNNLFFEVKPVPNNLFFEVRSCSFFFER